MKKEKNNFFITKASGDMIPFSEEKLKRSLLRSGASDEVASDIIEELVPQLYEGITTKKIYQSAFKLLKKNGPKRIAAKYKLKRGIMELGPSGFPFEKFVSELIRLQGYNITTGQVVKGQCVKHEIDIIAEKDHHHFMIECKYHNLPGTVCDVKIPLYIQARFKDVESEWLKLPDHGTKFHQGWVVTNTRFTSDAITYGTCAGLKLIGWDYPTDGGLKTQVDKLGLYPITCLTSLNRHEKKELVARRIVLCYEIIGNEALLLEIGIDPSRFNTIKEECKQLCGIKSEK